MTFNSSRIPCLRLSAPDWVLLWLPLYLIALLNNPALVRQEITR